MFNLELLVLKILVVCTKLGGLKQRVRKVVIGYRGKEMEMSKGG
jgi:hypothetical protein